MVADEKRRERLLFRSWHRGTREMDLLLGSFAEAHVHTLTETQLDEFESLLETSDPLVYEWITEQKKIPLEADNSVLQMLIRHKPNQTMVV